MAGEHDHFEYDDTDYAPERGTHTHGELLPTAGALQALNRLQGDVDQLGWHVEQLDALLELMLGVYGVERMYPDPTRPEQCVQQVPGRTPVEWRP